METYIEDDVMLTKDPGDDLDTLAALQNTFDEDACLLTCNPKPQSIQIPNEIKKIIDTKRHILGDILSLWNSYIDQKKNFLELHTLGKDDQKRIFSWVICKDQNSQYNHPASLKRWNLITTYYNRHSIGISKDALNLYSNIGEVLMVIRQGKGLPKEKQLSIYIVGEKLLKLTGRDIKYEELTELYVCKNHTFSSQLNNIKEEIKKRRPDIFAEYTTLVDRIEKAKCKWIKVDPVKSKIDTFLLNYDQLIYDKRWKKMDDSAKAQLILLDIYRHLREIGASECIKGFFYTHSDCLVSVSVMGFKLAMKKIEEMGFIQKIDKQPGIKHLQNIYRII